MQLQVPARLCNPADLTFAKASLTDKEMFEQRAMNNMLPRPHHPDLEAVDPKHLTRALAAAIHYQIRKKMFTKTEIADLFQVERKKFFTSITGREYKGGKKMMKKKLETSDTKEDRDKSTSTTQTEAPIDPEMPPLEDADAPTRLKQFKFKKPTPTKKHYQKK